MRALPDDARLLICILLNSLVLASAVRFVRRRHITDWVQVVIDAMLIWYLIQYLSITLPGMLGVLNVWTMMLVACALSTAMIVAPKSRPRTHEPSSPMSASDRRTVLACLVVLFAMIAAHVFNVRYAPPTANDAITYHLPAAVQWLQTGRLGYFQTWFFNPANTYSPLAGSTFIAWLIAPMQSDILARGVEAPALILIFVAIVQIARTLGTPVRIAALVALAACCARPLINQIFLAKDDLFVTAFFGVTVLAMTQPRLRDPLGPIRLGIALGLLLATKYTALLCVPVLLLMIQRGCLRRLAIACAVALALAGPWYLRNWIVTGNPVFPIDALIFNGMFATARSESLRSLAGIWQAFTNYSGLPPTPLRLVIAIWIAAMIIGFRRIARDSLTRTIVLGPPLMIVLFIATSPYAEVRFVYPAFLLVFAASVVVLGWRGHRVIITVLAIALVVTMIGTSFIVQSLKLMIEPGFYALIFGALIVCAIEFRSIALAALLFLTTTAFAYVYWGQYTNQYRNDATTYWGVPYGSLADAWKFVRDQTPGGTTIAYANTYFVHPLYGADLDHRIVYAPTRRGIRLIADLGHIDDRIMGEQIVTRVQEMMRRDPDRETWINNLRQARARYLVIAEPRAAASVPELQFARETAGFRIVCDNPEATIFEIPEIAR